MARQSMAAVTGMARYSSSTLMAQVLPTCTVSRPGHIIPQVSLLTATEPVHLPDYFCLATAYLGRPAQAGIQAMERCSRSTSMAQDLQTSIVSHRPLVILNLKPTATELIRLAV